MAKSKTMRVAVLMLALTLITSCFVGGTFAKYMSLGEGEDSARVAKWGVVVEGYGEGDSSFATSYDETGSVTVSATEKVVAPGTSSEGEYVSFKISGTPEVACKASIEMAVTSDVFLEIGEEGASQKYCPVVYTLEIKDNNTVGSADAQWTTAVTGTLEDIETFLEGTYADAAEFKPNTVLDAEYRLSWAWAFESDDPEESANDLLDTALGDIAAGLNVTEITNGEDSIGIVDYSTKIDYSIVITIEQVD